MQTESPSNCAVGQKVRLVERRFGCAPGFNYGHIVANYGNGLLQVELDRGVRVRLYFDEVEVIENPTTNVPSMRIGDSEPWKKTAA